MLMTEICKREVRKVRFIEPGNLPYRRSIRNLYTYDKYVRTPSIGLMTLATIAKRAVPDVRMYSESISRIDWKDVLDADIVFIGIFTFNANRGYELADRVRRESKALVAMGGLHASMVPAEAARHSDYVLLGEADETILTFMEALRSGGPLDFPGIARLGEDGTLVSAGYPPPPRDIGTIPDRSLLHRYRRMAGHNTIWPQVHASRGCPHSCDYCSLVRHFGRRVRTRTPENVVEDIKAAIAFHGGRFPPRLARILWITDDNFFADRAWAVSVLNAIIASGVRYHFTVQARFEVGFDDEMLELLKRAGFIELAMGIEFLEDDSFERYGKDCTRADVERSIANIRRHELAVRGLFIVGADGHGKGIGNKLARFAIDHDIKGILVQSMYFVPGTPVYDAYKDRLIHEDWSKCTGNVVHYPALLSPAELQREIIEASALVYSPKRLFRAIFREKGIRKLLFIGEYLWQRSVRADLRRELPALERAGRERAG